MGLWEERCQAGRGVKLEEGEMGLWEERCHGQERSEIGEEGEMGLWKEEYTLASDQGCLSRGFLI